MSSLTRSQKRKWSFRLIGLVFIAFGILVRVSDPYPVSATRMIYFDTLQRLKPREFDPDLPVKVVQIDEASLGALGQWPWPRTLLADLVTRLEELGAAAIAFDVLFAEPDRYSPVRLTEDPLIGQLLSATGDIGKFDSDVQFAEAIFRLPVVLGVAASIEEVGEQVRPKAGIIEFGEQVTGRIPYAVAWTPLAPPLEEYAEGIAGINVSPLEGLGTIRSVPLFWRGPTGVMPSLSLELLRVALQEPNIFVEGSQDEAGVMISFEMGGFTVPTTENGELWLNFRKDNKALYISAVDVLQSADHEQLASQIEGNLILVGASAAGLLDARQTALGETVPGVSIHAQVIEQILLGKTLKRSDITAATEIISYAALCLILLSVMSISGPIRSFISGGFVVTFVLAASWVLYTRYEVLFDATFPMIAGMLNFGVLAGYQFAITERDRRHIRNWFSHYVAEEMLTELETSGKDLELGGSTREITVLFADMIGFTSVSEEISSAKLIALLNDVFSRMGDEIFKERGTIDKFIGDSIMAFWNAPVEIESHEEHAVAAALGIRRALGKMNQTRRLESKTPIQFAMGLASGQASVGNIGSKHRFNYTAVGDVVNTAARNEAICRRVGYDIVVSEGVKEMTEARFAFLFAGRVQLKGKAERASLFVAVGDQKVAQSSDFRALAESHEALVRALAGAVDSSEWQVLLERCAEEARKLEPNLQRFYENLIGRSEDFVRTA
ncbi:adenylate/guanylate cyclase domain-containing protein [uncultured Shimia sp.]|uniref:CHASE2 domain-containing protein n=1 Tax=uncultured Shimia sp. TaxID=573152 RepID=UPI002622EC8C|nr:adenylate/guanylate cyclase domain-containing protein [uncultured Shimia sp.]